MGGQWVTEQMIMDFQAFQVVHIIGMGIMDGNLAQLVVMVNGGQIQLLWAVIYIWRVFYRIKTTSLLSQPTAGNMLLASVALKIKSDS